jgi:hypothetical protein
MASYISALNNYMRTLAQKSAQAQAQARAQQQFTPTSPPVSRFTPTSPPVSRFTPTGAVVSRFTPTPAPAPAPPPPVKVASPSLQKFQEKIKKQELVKKELKGAELAKLFRDLKRKAVLAERTLKMEQRISPRARQIMEASIQRTSDRMGRESKYLEGMQKNLETEGEKLDKFLTASSVKGQEGVYKFENDAKYQEALSMINNFNKQAGELGKRVEDFNSRVTDLNKRVIKATPEMFVPRKPIIYEGRYLRVAPDEKTEEYAPDLKATDLIYKEFGGTGKSATKTVKETVNYAKDLIKNSAGYRAIQKDDTIPPATKERFLKTQMRVAKKVGGSIGVLGEVFDLARTGVVYGVQEGMRALKPERKLIEVTLPKKTLQMLRKEQDRTFEGKGLPFISEPLVYMRINENHVVIPRRAAAEISGTAFDVVIIASTALTGVGAGLALIRLSGKGAGKIIGRIATKATSPTKAVKNFLAKTNPKNLVQFAKNIKPAELKQNIKFKALSKADDLFPEHQRFIRAMQKKTPEPTTPRIAETIKAKVPTAKTEVAYRTAEQLKEIATTRAPLFQKITTKKSLTKFDKDLGRALGYEYKAETSPLRAATRTRTNLAQLEKQLEKNIGRKPNTNLKKFLETTEGRIILKQKKLFIDTQGKLIKHPELLIKKPYEITIKGKKVGFTEPEVIKLIKTAHETKYTQPMNPVLKRILETPAGKNLLKQLKYEQKQGMILTKGETPMIKGKPIYEWEDLKDAWKVNIKTGEVELISAYEKQVAKYLKDLKQKQPTLFQKLKTKFYEIWEVKAIRTRLDKEFIKYYKEEKRLLALKKEKETSILKKLANAPRTPTKDIKALEKTMNQIAKKEKLITKKFMANKPIAEIKRNLNELGKLKKQEFEIMQKLAKDSHTRTAIQKILNEFQALNQITLNTKKILTTKINQLQNFIKKIEVKPRLKKIVETPKTTLKFLENRAKQIIPTLQKLLKKKPIIEPTKTERILAKKIRIETKTVERLKELKRKNPLLTKELEFKTEQQLITFEKEIGRALNQKYTPPRTTLHTIFRITENLKTLEKKLRLGIGKQPAGRLKKFLNTFEGQLFSKQKGYQIDPISGAIRRTKPMPIARAPPKPKPIRAITPTIRPTKKIIHPTKRKPLPTPKAILLKPIQRTFARAMNQVRLAQQGVRKKISQLEARTQKKMIRTKEQIEAEARFLKQKTKGELQKKQAQIELELWTTHQKIREIAETIKYYSQTYKNRLWLPQKKLLIKLKNKANTLTQLITKAPFKTKQKFLQIKTKAVLRTKALQLELQKKLADFNAHALGLKSVFKTMTKAQQKKYAPYLKKLDDRIYRLRAKIVSKILKQPVPPTRKGLTPGMRKLKKQFKETRELARMEEEIIRAEELLAALKKKREMTKTARRIRKGELHTKAEISIPEIEAMQKEAKFRSMYNEFVVLEETYYPSKTGVRMADLIPRPKAPTAVRTLDIPKTLQIKIPVELTRLLKLTQTHATLNLQKFQAQLRQELKQKTLTNTKLIHLFVQNTAQTQKQRMKMLRIFKLMPKTIQRYIENTLLAYKQLTGIKFRELELQAQRFRQKTLTKQKLLPKLKTKPRIPPFIPPFPILKLTPEIVKKLDKTRKTFNVIINRLDGKKVMANKKPLQASHALALGHRIVEHTLARSFFITPTKTEAKKLEKTKKIPLQQYRQPVMRTKLPRISLVEKSKYALNTRGEKTDIKKLRQLQAKREKLIKRKRLQIMHSRLRQVREMKRRLKK